MTLQEFFAQHHNVALALSGGVDSAYLLWAAAAAGARVQPYYVRTCFQPASALADAQQLCRELGLELRTVEVDILTAPAVQCNGPRRCYHCKKQMFTALREAARRDGCLWVVEGTNADDDAADRPGMQALQELGILSPLRLCGLTKSDIRQRARQAGLSLWDKPANACLATRIPTGTPITPADLARVERGENTLTELGFTDLRVRLRGKTALIQLPAAQMPQLLTHREEILQALQADFDTITLDLEARA